MTFHLLGVQWWNGVPREVLNHMASSTGRGFNPASDSQIRLGDGRRMGFAQYGDPAGRPLFFFQGTPSSRLLHPDQTITRSLGVRHIQLDRPGFGLSDFQPGRTLLDWPDDVAKVADRLGIERFAVVGVSGGGPYVAACAYRIPQRLTAAAMVGSVAPLDGPVHGRNHPQVPCPIFPPSGALVDVYPLARAPHHAARAMIDRPEGLLPLPGRMAGSTVGDL